VNKIIIATIIALVALPAFAGRVKTSKNGIEFIKKMEGFSATPYIDGKAVAIGYGHNMTKGENYKKITKEKAEKILLSDIAIAEDAIKRLVKTPLNQAQHDALVSFIYNIGQGAFSRSTLLKKLNSGDYSGAANEFKRWDKAGGKRLPGLTKRRAMEAAIFKGGLR